MVLGLIAATVLAHGSLIKAIAMVILGLLLGLVGTDVNSGVARFSFGVSELSDGIGFVSVAMGVFGFRRDHRQPRTQGKSRNLHQEGEQPAAFHAGLQGYVGVDPAWHCSGLVPRNSARRRCAACFLRRLHAGEKGLEEFREFRQGRDPGRGSAESANNAGAQTSFIPLLTPAFRPTLSWR